MSCMSSICEYYHEKEKKKEGETGLRLHQGTQFRIIPLSLFFEYIEHKYIETLSCLRGIRTPTLTRRLKS